MGEVKVREMSWKEAGGAKKSRNGFGNIDKRVFFSPKQLLKTILSWLCFWQSELSRDCANCANTWFSCVSENRLHVWFEEGVRPDSAPSDCFSFLFFIYFFALILWLLYGEKQQSHKKEKERRKKNRPQYHWLFSLQQLQEKATLEPLGDSEKFC